MKSRQKVVAVVQARMGSTRLPGKVMLPAAGRPLLQRMLDRVRAARELDAVVVATTRLAVDDSIRSLCAAMGLPCVSGHATDLLDRHVEAARATDADVVVKIPSDCPLVDPRVIDRVVGAYRRNRHRFDFVTNLRPPTWPDGNDVEVMTREVLETAWREAARPYEREHTTPFIWDQPARFRIGNVTAGDDGGFGDGEEIVDRSQTHRLTLDYPDDYRLISAVFQALLKPDAPPFSVDDVVAFLDAHPEVRALNAAHLGSSWITAHENELRTNTGGDTSAGASGVGAQP